jgi:hypothetical protein
MSALDNLWPKGVGYEYDSEKEPVERAERLIESWKWTVLDHGFKSHAVTTLLFRGETLTYTLQEEPNKAELLTMRCKVRKIQVSIDIDEAPGDSSVNCKIEGTNLQTNREFTYFFSVYRWPKVSTSIHKK